MALRIKALREERKLTQEIVLKDTGIHFGRIEMGKRDVSISTLKKICFYFGITLQAFFRKGFEN